MRRDSATANSPTTKAFRRRRRVRLAVPPRLPSPRDSRSSARTAWNAGTSPKATPARTDTTSVAASTSGSSSGTMAFGISGGMAPWSHRTTATAMRMPRPPATTPNVTLSVSSWRRIR